MVRLTRPLTSHMKREKRLWCPPAMGRVALEPNTSHFEDMFFENVIYVLIGYLQEKGNGTMLLLDFLCVEAQD
jgi:hypothetical protein